MSGSTRVPEDFHTITPQLVVRGAATALDWYGRAFGAHELLRNAAPGGEGIMHAELLLGDSRFFVADELPTMRWAPESLGGSPITLHLYVDDADGFVERAVAAGAELLMSVEARFWGDRYGMIRDPFGHRWSVATRVEDLSPRGLRSRAEAWARENTLEKE